MCIRDRSYSLQLRTCAIEPRTLLSTMIHRTKPCAAKTLISDTFGLSGPSRLCTLKHIKRSSTLALGKDASSASARTAWRIASVVRVHKPYAKAANVIFIETPSVVPALDFETAFDEGTFAYDEPDDLVRDVRNFLPRKDLGWSSFSSRTKHIALRFFYVRELVNDGATSIKYVRTENQLADIGTKFLNNAFAS